MSRLEQVNPDQSGDSPAFPFSYFSLKNYLRCKQKNSFSSLSNPCMCNVADYFYLTTCIRVCACEENTLVGERINCPFDDVGNKF